MLFIPRFLQNFADGLRGDFNKQPEARSYIWLAVFTGTLMMGLAVYAGFLGLPLYQQMLANTSAPTLFAILLVLLVCGTIFTANQVVGMYLVEKAKFGVSRTNGGRILWIFSLMVIMLSFDIFMNHGGEKLRNTNYEGQQMAAAAGQSFSYSRQPQLDAITQDIERLQHPKAHNCKGWTACKSTCPLVAGGSAHDPNGSLTRFGRKGLVSLQEKAAALEAERAEDKARFMLASGAQVQQVATIAAQKKTASKWVVLGIYLVMIVASIVLAALDLAFEEAAGIGMDYDKLEAQQTEREERISARRKRRANNRKDRRQRNELDNKSQASMRRQERRQKLAPHATPTLSNQTVDKTGDIKEKTEAERYTDLVDLHRQLERIIFENERKKAPKNGYEHPSAAQGKL